MPTKSKPAIPPKVSHKPLIVLGVLVLLVIGGLTAWTIYQGQQVSADKARFAQAERDINDLSAQVVAAVGTPVKTTSEKFCSRPNLEFETGPLSCDIKWLGYYEINDFQQATGYQNTVRRILQEKWQSADFKSLSNDSTDGFRDLDQKNTSIDGDTLRILGETTASDGMKCSELSTFYLGDRPPYGNYLKTTSSRYVMAIDLSCSDKAKVEHYPIKS